MCRPFAITRTRWRPGPQSALMRRAACAASGAGSSFTARGMAASLGVLCLYCIQSGEAARRLGVPAVGPAMFSDAVDVRMTFPLPWSMRWSSGRPAFTPGKKATGCITAGAQADGISAAHVTAVPGVFETHGLCDSGTPWFDPASLALTLGFVDPGSFHPTTDGQQQGYEVAFSRQ